MTQEKNLKLKKIPHNHFHCLTPIAAVKTLIQIILVRYAANIKVIQDRHASRPVIIICTENGRIHNSSIFQT